MIPRNHRLGGHLLVLLVGLLTLVAAVHLVTSMASGSAPGWLREADFGIGSLVAVELVASRVNIRDGLARGLHRVAVALVLLAFPLWLVHLLVKSDAIWWVLTVIFAAVVALEVTSLVVERRRGRAIPEMRERE